MKDLIAAARTYDRKHGDEIPPEALAVIRNLTAALAAVETPVADSVDAAIQWIETYLPPLPYSQTHLVFTLAVELGSIPMQYGVADGMGRMMPETFDSEYDARVFACGGFEPPRGPLGGRIVLQRKIGNWEPC